MDLDLALKGSDLRKVSMQAQLGDDKSVSVTTNPSDRRPNVSVRVQRHGNSARLIGVYAQVQGGGAASCCSRTRTTRSSYGDFKIKNFAILDEAKLEADRCEPLRFCKMISKQQQPI